MTLVLKLVLLFVFAAGVRAQCTNPAPVTRTHCGSGCQHASVQACHDFVAGDLVTADENWICEANDSNIQDGTLVIDGSTTEPGCTIAFSVHPDHRHSGATTATSGQHFVLSIANSDLVTILDENITLEYMQFQLTAGTGSVKRLVYLNDGGNHFIKSNLFACNNASGTSVSTQVSGHVDIVTEWTNNAFIGCQNGSYGSVRVNGANPVNRFYGNTFGDTSFAMRCNLTECINNLLKYNACNKTSGNNECWYSATLFETGSDYNFSSDSPSTGGTNDQIDVIWSFVNEAAGDVHLLNATVPGVDEGPTTCAEIPVDFDHPPHSRVTDRGTACDIGADEVFQADEPAGPRRRVAIF